MGDVDGFGFFVKLLYLRDYYAVLAYFTDYWTTTSLKFRIVKYNDYSFSDVLTYDFTDFSILEGLGYNGLFKLDDNRLVLASVKCETSTDGRHLYFFVIDLYEDYTKMKMRRFNFKYPGQFFIKESSVSYYNGYITLAATIGDNENEFPTGIKALLIIFGFGNGTDFEIDISPYLMDTGYYDKENNLFNRLMLNLTIDNNIFGYEKVYKIRLVKICPELLFYRGEYNKTQESEQFPLNDDFDANITLLQNRAIKKEENKLYTLEYQYFVKQPNYTIFKEMPRHIINVPDNFDGEQYYERKILPGRTNILKFKLCHNYCGTCIEYGLTNNDQRCDTCKEPYTYDYLAYVNRFTGNCVPKDQMYDVEEHVLKNCEGSEYKYYFNTSHGGERFCFKYVVLNMIIFALMFIQL